MWHYEGGNFLVDEEFMNYLAFIVDVCEWRTGLTPEKPETLLERAGRVFVDRMWKGASNRHPTPWMRP